jgi:hypothetical protein
MRRGIGFFVWMGVALLLAAAVPGLNGGWAAAQFATNTPRPTQFAFATNTPPRPTTTATATATATFTATATPTTTPTATQTPSPTPTPNGPYRYPEEVNSLTGLPYPNDAARDRRNLIVKISNYPPIVRPQTGINLADMVWEYETEGGVTRFAAIFRSNAPTKVGSVRSARLIDLQLVPMFNALLAYSGTSDPIQNMILNNEEDPYRVFQFFSPLKGDNCENAGFCRFERPGLPFEHTLFLDTTVLWDLATRRNVNTGTKARGLAFSEFPDTGGQPANDIFIDWYGQTDARWQYDATTGRYLRYTDGVPHVDAGDGEQLWADNLIVVEAEHRDRPDLFEPESKTASLDIILEGQGRVMVFRDGQWFQGFWRRESNEPGNALVLIYGNNQPIMLKPGRSWVSVVRGFGDVITKEQQADMVATGTALALSATPTPSPTATP